MKILPYSIASPICPYIELDSERSQSPVGVRVTDLAFYELSDQVTVIVNSIYAAVIKKISDYTTKEIILDFRSKITSNDVYNKCNISFNAKAVIFTNSFFSTEVRRINKIADHIEDTQNESNQF